VSEPQVSRFTQLVRRVWSLKERYAPSLLEDIFPTFELGDFTEPNLIYLLGGRRILRSKNVLGPAGFLPAALLQVPTPQTLAAGTPPVIFDVTQLVITNHNASAQGFYVEFFASLQGLVGANQLTVLDGRLTTFADSTDVARSTIRFLPLPNSFAGAPITRHLVLLVPPQSSVIIPYRATMTPGSALQMRFLFVAGTATFNVEGIERLVEPSELF